MRTAFLRKTSTHVYWRMGHLLLAIVMAGLLVVFLVATRLFSAAMPDREIREVEVLEVALPAPPPPPVEPDEPPPPPQRVELPRLDIQLDPVAPPLKATLDPETDFKMKTALFEVEVDPPPAPKPEPAPRPKPAPKVAAPKPQPVMRSTYSAGELDSQPRLLNHPSSSFPTALARQGVREGRVTLEVEISTSGRVSVRRVLSSSHEEFSRMATDIARRARFSTPTKNGTPVTAVYQWPLILRP